MAEHGIGESIAAGLATCLAFLGVLGAALKFWDWEPESKGPEKEEADMGALLQRVAKLEQRADAHETARVEQRADFNKVFEKLDDLTEIAARLDGKLSTKGGGG